MDKIYIKVDRKTGMVYLDNTVIGRDNENLQQELIFSFENGFVYGSPRLEYKVANNKYHMPMQRDGETYKIAVKNILTKEGKIELQLVIVQAEQDEEIPVFKSNVFYVYCNKSINAQEEPMDDYEYWLDVIEEKLAEVDEALDELDNIDIDATKSGSTATVSITNKEGTTKSVEIYDGETGQDGYSPTALVNKSGNVATITITDKNGTTTASVNDGINGIDGIDGKDAKINGVNTLSIEAGTNISIDQQGSTLTINSTGGGTSDYEELDNLPQINSIELKGNVSSSTLGVQNIEDNTLQTTNKTIPTAINEVNSIAKGANQAVGYNNYSDMITALNAMDDDEYNVGQNVYIVTVNVPDLWVSSVESTSSTYTYVDDATVVNDLETNGYIQVGYYKLSMLETQKADLTNYVTNTDYAGSNKAGVIRTNADYGTSITSVGALISATKTYRQYQDTTTNNMFISKGTLENVIAGKGLVSNTDYASNNTGGVVKTSTNYGTSIDSNGSLRGTTKTYADYNSMHNLGLISKVTLENVINGKGLNISSINSGENVNITNLLPNGYTRLEYIESSGTQYIDPSVASSNTIGININYSYSTINSSTNAGICGIYQGNNPRTDSLLITTVSGKTNGDLFFAHRGVIVYGGHTPTANKIYNVKINWRNSGVLDFEEQTTNVGTNNAESGAIHLFGRKSGSSYTYASLKIYSCQFSDETKMIRNLIPAKRNSDSVIGMYDTVNGVFYENEGTGTFTAGAELDNIPKISFKNEDGYVTNTDYASSSKGGVIKTGSSYGTTMASGGTLRATAKTYEEYSSAGSYMFISKGTLENAITGKELDLKQLSTFDATKTQVLKNINGTLTWVDE